MTKQQLILIRINIAVMSITMAVVSRSPPNYSAARKSLGVSPGPVVTSSFTHLSFYSKVIFLYCLYMIMKYIYRRLRSMVL